MRSATLLTFLKFAGVKAFESIDPLSGSNVELMTFSRREWEALPENKKRSLFHTANIHVYGGKPEDVGGVKGWDIESLSSVVDIYQTLQCQGNIVCVQMMPRANHLFAP